MTPETRRPRVLIVTRNLPPLVGGMERLNWHMADELAKIADVRVIGPQGAGALAPQRVGVRETPLKPLWKFLVHARAMACREARTWKPDIVLAGSGLTAPLARAAARQCGAKTAVYVHGLDVAVENLVYRVWWLPAIRRMDRVIANSHATAGLCHGIGVDPARIGIVHPGVDLPHEPPSHQESCSNEGDASEPLSSGETGRVRHVAVEPLSHRERGRGEGPGTRNASEPTQPSTSSLRAPRSGDPGSSSSTESATSDQTFRIRHNLVNRPLLLSVGRLTTRKGLREFVAQCLPRIVATQPEVVLLIVGDAPNDALHAQTQSPESIRQAAGRAGVANSVKFLGRLPETELLAAYCAADVHIFPVRGIPGDPEGFGMVAVEAAAHGLPTVAFATGGVVDAVAEGQSGHLVSPGDYAAFADAALQTLTTREAMRASCIAFARRFAWPAFGRQIAAQLQGVTSALDPGGAAP